MSTINAYLTKDALNIKQTRVKRDWMDDTFDAHAYHCFPLSLANSIGYEISLPEDITFIWNGNKNHLQENVTMLTESKYCTTGRGHGTVSFNSGIILKTDQDMSIMHMPVPNIFNENYQAFTSIISTSFYDSPIPLAIKILKPNVEITIKADEPFITLLPISLTSLSKVDMNIEDFEFPKSYYEYHNERNKINKEIVDSGNWTDWYRDATDHTENSIGSHEVKSLKLKINDNRRTNG
jgi:hypothetical protein